MLEIWDHPIWYLSDVGHLAGLLAQEGLFQLSDSAMSCRHAKTNASAERNGREVTRVPCAV